MGGNVGNDVRRFHVLASLEGWSGDWTFNYTLAWVPIEGGFIVPVVTVNYLAWDPMVVPIDPYTGQPMGGGDGLNGSGGGSEGAAEEDGGKEDP